MNNGDLEVGYQAALPPLDLLVLYSIIWGKTLVEALRIEQIQTEPSAGLRRGGRRGLNPN